MTTFKRKSQPKIWTDQLVYIGIKFPLQGRKKEMIVLKFHMDISVSSVYGIRTKKKTLRVKNSSNSLEYTIRSIVPSNFTCGLKIKKKKKKCLFLQIYEGERATTKKRVSFFFFFFIFVL